jgi:hypothetical protein
MREINTLFNMPDAKSTCYLHIKLIANLEILVTNIHRIYLLDIISLKIRKLKIHIEFRSFDNKYSWDLIISISSLLHLLELLFRIVDIVMNLNILIKKFHPN